MSLRVFLNFYISVCVIVIVWGSFLSLCACVCVCVCVRVYMCVGVCQLDFSCVCVSVWECVCFYGSLCDHVCPSVMSMYLSWNKKVFSFILIHNSLLSYNFSKCIYGSLQEYQKVASQTAVCVCFSVWVCFLCVFCVSVCWRGRQKSTMIIVDQDLIMSIKM